MGKIIKLTFLFLLIVVQAQSYNVLYELDVRTQKEDTIHSKEFFVLAIDMESKKSLFENAKVFEKRNKNTQKYFSTHGIEQHLYNKIFKDFTDNKFQDFIRIANRWFNRPFNFPKNRWKVLPNQKQIKGYACQKAEIEFGGRIWEAWYTTDIPIVDGPYKFYGLPGLILEVHSKDNDYHFRMKKLTKEKLDWFLPRSLSIDDENLVNLTKRITEDPSYRLRQVDSNPNFEFKTYFNGKELKFDNAYYEKRNKEYWEWQKKHTNPLVVSEIWVK